MVIFQLDIICIFNFSNNFIEKLLYSYFEGKSIKKNVKKLYIFEIFLYFFNF